MSDVERKTRQRVEENARLAQSRKKGSVASTGRGGPTSPGPVSPAYSDAVAGHPVSATSGPTASSGSSGGGKVSALGMVVGR